MATARRPSMSGRKCGPRPSLHQGGPRCVPARCQDGTVQSRMAAGVSRAGASASLVEGRSAALVLLVDLSLDLGLDLVVATLPWLADRARRR